MVYASRYISPGAQKNTGLIMTQQGNLQCKKIIHVSTKNNLATIQKRVQQALEMCVKHGFTSIAFPAFGTGELQDFFFSSHMTKYI